MWCAQRGVMMEGGKGTVSSACHTLSSSRCRAKLKSCADHGGNPTYKFHIATTQQHAKAYLCSKGFKLIKNKIALTLRQCSLLLPPCTAPVFFLFFSRGGCSASDKPPSILGGSMLLRKRQSCILLSAPHLLINANTLLESSSHIFPFFFSLFFFSLSIERIHASRWLQSSISRHPAIFLFSALTASSRGPSRSQRPKRSIECLERLD